jgi:predicted dehydrogenase
MPSRRFTRRTFVKSIAYAGALAPLIDPRIVRAVAANSRLNIAGVGVGGKGASDLAETSAIATTKGLTPEQAYEKRQNNVVGLADVDDNTLAGAAKRYPGAKTFNDWREMFDKMHKEIDAVTISTPDHMHAPVTMTALQLGKHTYTQKPLTHDVYEARQLRNFAAAHPKLVTQMGNQHHSSIQYRMLVELIQTGVIGKVKEAHAWSDRPIWPRGMERPQGEDPVPPHLHWDLWIGTAPFRPFVGPRGDSNKKGRGWYHPFAWRGILDFGTGAQGDMACHIMDPVVWSLDLQAPHAGLVRRPAAHQRFLPRLVGDPIRLPRHQIHHRHRPRHLV